MSKPRVNPPAIRPTLDVLQTDTAMFSQSGGNRGIGFAVPINIVRAVMDHHLVLAHTMTERWSASTSTCPR